jgi:hypothetical protein
VVFCVVFFAVEKHATFSGFIFEGIPILGMRRSQNQRKLTAF